MDSILTSIKKLLGITEDENKNELLFCQRHPYLPLGVSLAALMFSIITLIIKIIL